jgi:hypothetical protein
MVVARRAGHVARTFFALGVAGIATVACGPITWVSTDGGRTVEGPGTDGARLSLIQSAIHDMRCTAEGVTVVMGGQMGRNSLVTGCGRMCGYDYVAYGVTVAGWRLRSCAALQGGGGDVAQVTASTR